MTISPLLVPRGYVVVDKVEEAPDVFTLKVHPLEGDLPSFRPAQVSMLGAFGIGEAAISISSAPSVSSYHAYTIRRAGPITNALVDTPIAGVITVRGPFGAPWPFEEVSTSNLLIVAGGLGIAPLRAQIHDAAAQSHRFGRLTVLYGAKSPRDLVFLDDLRRWGTDKADVRCTIDDPDESWSGPVGFVTDLIEPDNGDGAWADTTAFICGPDPMMRATSERLIEVGVDPNNIWVTLERNMQCGNALCGHCQLGPILVCRDGPVVNYSRVARFLSVAEM